MTYHNYKVRSSAGKNSKIFSYDEISGLYLSHGCELFTCRQTARTAKIYWEDFVAKNSHRPLMRPYICGTVCPDACCCCCNSVDAIDYYTEEEIRYNREVQIEREKALTKPLGIAFLTFKTVDMAERVVSDYRFTAQVFCQTPSSKFSRKLKSKRWTVKFAPLPQDIYW